MIYTFEEKGQKFPIVNGLNEWAEAVYGAHGNKKWFKSENMNQMRCLQTFNYSSASKASIILNT